MESKVCTACKVDKPFSEYNKAMLGKYGLNSECRECSLKRTMAHKRTKDGLVTTIYSGQKHSSKKRGHAAPTYSKKWLKDWLFNNPEFHRLYDIWVLSQYNKDLKPSVDRLDDALGYTEYNIQLLDWVSNKNKAYKAGRDGKFTYIAKKQKRVIQYSKKGNMIAEYISLREASRQTSVPYSSLNGACKGKTKYAGGYIWKIKDSK